MADAQLLDQNRLKSGQALTIILLIVGFVLNSWVLVAFVALAQFMGALALPLAPYGLIYRYAILPSGLVKPNPQPDHPEPHRFAMAVGTVFNLATVIALLAGGGLLAWIPVGIVIALANLNFWLSFCLGCWMYYQFNRLGVPGFAKAPIHD